MVYQSDSIGSNSNEMPLVFSTPFWRSFWYHQLPFLVILIAIGYSRAYPPILQIGVVILAIAAALHARDGIRDQRVLRLKVAGFQCQRGQDGFTINWLDVSPFEIETRKVGLIKRQVIRWSYDDIQPMRHQARNPSKELTSREDWIVAQDYGQKPQELASLMNDYRQRAIQRATEKR